MKRSAKSILHLTLKRKWFDEISAGKKRQEYREYKKYWKNRLEGREYDYVQFRNGYASNAPKMLVEYLGLRRAGKARDADYVIRLGRVIKKWR